MPFGHTTEAREISVYFPQSFIVFLHCPTMTDVESVLIYMQTTEVALIVMDLGGRSGSRGISRGATTTVV